MNTACKILKKVDIPIRDPPTLIGIIKRINKEMGIIEFSHIYEGIQVSKKQEKLFKEG